MEKENAKRYLRQQQPVLPRNDESPDLPLGVGKGRPMMLAMAMCKGLGGATY